jgi:endonuclease/exonuclease/phosphatase family metal-dependent hydrolase
VGPAFTGNMVPQADDYPLQAVPEATIATFNIRHGRGRDGRVDLARVAGTIERTGSSLIALQELDRFNPRSGGVDQPAELERLTGFSFIFLPTVVREGREYGIALGHRGGLLEDMSSLNLPRIGQEEPRKAIVGRWAGISIVATHLSVERETNGRQQEALAEAIAPTLPGTVVLGDLNATRGRLEPLLAVGLRTPRIWRPTVDPWWRFRRIDHVMGGPLMEVVRAGVIPTEASDHRPVVVSFRWRVEDVAGVTYDA